jgi:hypothetical protein
MRRRDHRRCRPLLWAAGLVACAPAAADPALEARVQSLEAQLRTLTARVAALEQRGAGETASTGIDEAPAAIVWTLGDLVAGTPFRITHKQLDVDGGRLDLLLEITAPLAEPTRWTAPGSEVPLAVTLRDAGGHASRHGFRLARGASAEPGARLHLSTSIDPARAAAARQLIIDEARD